MVPDNGLVQPAGAVRLADGGGAMNATSALAVAATWRRSLPPLLLLLLALLLIYRDTVTAMVLIWSRSDTFAHAFLVLPISLWLIWRQRQTLALHAPEPAAWILPALAAVGLAWLLGELVAVNSVTQLALTAMLVLAVPALLGLRVASVMLFPLGFVFFAVPIGEFIMPTLIDWTADFTVQALRLSGIPVFREGNQFVIPSGSWSVVEACSGVRYLIASFMVGSLFAYLNYRSTRRRMIFAIVSILVPVIANWLRAYMIVMLGHLSGNRLAVGADHLIYGWVFFGIVITLLFMIGARWSEPDVAPVAPATLAGAAARPRAGTLTWTVTLAAVLLAAAPQVALWAVERGEAAGAPNLTLPAAPVLPWQARAALTTDFRPAFAGPSAQVLGSFQDGAQTVGLYVAYYRQQNDNHKLVSSQNVLVASNDTLWNLIATGTQPLVLPDRTLTLRSAQLLRVQQAGEADRLRLLVWQLYWVNGTLTSNDYMAKMAGAWHRLQGRGDDSAAVVVYAQEATPGGAEQALASFLKSNFGVIEASLVAAHDSGRTK